MLELDKSLNLASLLSRANNVSYQFSSVQPMIAPVGLGHLLRCFRYQLSEMYGFAQLEHLKQPRSPACATNDKQASLNSLVFCGSDFIVSVLL